ncbi:MULTISPECIES: LysR family transcriptional regulator [unclassified Variovorax]|jgi:DNA-binding transcriptional LysR family regulator|uniref:LysR family transcriptional regulator n=1 Tax=Variovorax TaxID=34072 RepID=UPI0008E79821|nr:MULTISPECIES: LysR family transcriptional regulator [unclassified Variovorax]KAF1065819.1 MAG: Hca operon transcriptional activator HcaR [Variovorax sp.]TAJ59109.1 MAG: LysR family transcriptional regulator [Variovorax sp.]SFO88365.1 DNA-binding transcriptional regulator, LysR family [Variovorax sp. PDC80]
MELRQLRQVLVLSETLNFHRAAERLHMAQPPLSTSIKKLEEELGVLLFERLSTGLQLTPAGEAVLQNAKRALFYADEIRRAAREGMAGEQGLLRIGFVGSATYSLMPQIVRGFHRQYPRVDLVIEESTTTELLRRIEDHSLDIALVRHPVLSPTTALLTVLQLDHLVLAVSADSALAQRGKVAIADLAAEPFIAYSRTLVPAMHVLTMQVFQDAGVRPRIAQEAVQVQTILGLVESGLGVALVPAVVQRYASNGVRLLPLTDMPSKYTVGIAMATLADALTPAARNFIAVAHAAVQPLAQSS